MHPRSRASCRTRPLSGPTRPQCRTARQAHRARPRPATTRRCLVERARDCRQPFAARTFEPAVKWPARRSRKLRTPSAASALRERAARSHRDPRPPRVPPPLAPRGRSRASPAPRAGPARRPREQSRSPARAAWGPERHLLDQADPHRFLGAKLLRGKQEPHGVPQPSCAGARNVAPPNGMMPRAISSWPKRTSSAATTMSDASASSIDSVNAIPEPPSRSAWVPARPRRRRGHTALGPRARAVHAQQRPAPPHRDQARPRSDRRGRQAPGRSSRSAPRRSYAAASCSIVDRSKALRFSGLLTPTSRTCPCHARR